MIIRRTVLLFALAVTAVILPCAELAAQNEVFTVVLDPGHGGEDPGALYGGVKEKDINLAVALKLGGLIAENCPDVRVMYTRRTDVFVGLAERGQIANRADADLFISLHADAIEGKPAVKGASTYIMGMDKTENNLREAMRENSVMKYEDDYTEKYEGFDPTSAESYIIFNLMQYAWFDRSLQLAAAIQKRYEVATAFVDRGAKQGPFLVLWKAAMPSVLTEMGFVSNDDDRRYMTSERGRNAIAKAIADAFTEYYRSVTAVRPETNHASNHAVTEPGTAENRPVATKAGSRTVGFYVQLCASRNRIDDGDARFAPYKADPVEKRADGWYKYYFGAYTSLDDAVAVRDEVKRGDFKDAFVIAFDGDQQITIDEARRRIAANK